MSAAVEVLERADGHSGELVLRRNGADLEVILNGAFLISTANDASSRAMVSAALPYLAGERLDVLVGGLGLGYALDEALQSPQIAHVTVVEIEPTIVLWFRACGGERAARAAAGERAGRARIECADVAHVLHRDTARYDLVTLDTDNGPAWLVRDRNARLYATAGARMAAAALRPGGAAVFWSPDRYPGFEATLSAVFTRVVPVPAFDVVQGRRHVYTMYVALTRRRRGRLGVTRQGGGVPLTWQQPDDVAWALIDAYPDTDPLDLNFVDLHRMVVELDGFAGDPDEASEPILEAIVMAWHEQR